MEDNDYGLSQRRYNGRPLLRLLDCYALAPTGNLAPEMEAKVAHMVDTTFGAGPDWKTVLSDTIHLPVDMDERIRELWHAHPGGTDPLRFLAASDKNFLPMIHLDLQG